MRLVNLAQVNLFVEDFPTMLHFYRDQLGCTVSDLVPGPPAEPLVNWAHMIVGNMILELFDATAYCKDIERLHADTREAIELSFIVDDVHAERARLEKAGITCEPVIAEEWGQFAYFRDPEGNRLQIFQVFATQ
jgi:catechol 2,3-dioxygenase-like lactoylglutathione lyase family enzyme